MKKVCALVLVLAGCSTATELPASSEGQRQLTTSLPGVSFYKMPPPPPLQEAPPDPSMPGKRCTIRGRPCTPEQVAAIAETQARIDRIREKERRAAEAAAALGRPAGFVDVGDPREYVWQQWGEPDRKDFVTTPHGSMEWWFYDDGKAVALVDDRVWSTHW